MYIRLRKNKSGTTTVYLIDSVRVEGKKHSYGKVVKCFGSNAEQSIIDKWIQEAEALKLQLSSKKISSRSFTTIKQDIDINSCKVEELGIRYLYSNIYNNIFSKLELKGINREMLEDLVIMRLAMPVSKLKTANISSSFGIEDMTINKIYKLMDKMGNTQIEAIKRHVLKNTQSMLGESIKVMFYDLTTVYFEANSQTDLKEFGFSKDGKSQHVQISLALIVTEHGMPMGYEIFKGNTFEGATLIPTLDKLKNKYGISDVTIVADSAMLSDKNIQALIDHKYKFIVSAKIRNMSKARTSEALNSDKYKELNSLRYKSINLDKDKRLLCIFSEERKRKDEYDRSKALEKLRKLEGKSSKSGLKGSLKKAYIKVNNDSVIELDEKKIEESKKLDGYFGFISNTDLDAESIITQYRGLWQVEQSFRITKHNLKIRPVYHYVDRRIKAHFAICYLSLALLRALEYKLKQVNQYIPIEELHTYLGQIKEVKLTVNDQESTITTDIPDEIRKIFVALNISLPKRYCIKSRV
jgi:transposase